MSSSNSQAILSSTFTAPQTTPTRVSILTSIVPEDALLFGVPMPHHDGAILGPCHHIAVLVDVALWAADAGHDVKMTIDDLTDLGCNRGSRLSECRYQQPLQEAHDKERLANLYMFNYFEEIKYMFVFYSLTSCWTVTGRHNSSLQKTKTDQ